MAVDSNVNLRVTSTLSNALDLTTGYAPVDYTVANVLPSGTAANQADRVFSDIRTLGPSATENLDFAGVLLDAFGATITMARLKFVLFLADPLNNVANSVVVTRHATTGIPLFTAVSAGISLLPGAWFAVGSPGATGYPVTGGTADMLTITNSAGTNSVNYTVIAIGASV